MRIAILALMGLTAWGQFPMADNDSLREAVAPVEEWLGSPLVIVADATPIPQPDPGEAYILQGRIHIPLAQLRAFRTPVELARFLSHAAAHNRLGHPADYARMLEAKRLATTVPEFPPKYIESMESALKADHEKQAAPLAAEFLTKSGCTVEKCEMFQRLLSAANQL